MERSMKMSGYKRDAQKEVVYMKHILVRAEATGDKIILYKEDFSFEDLLAKGATLTPGVGYLKLNGREVGCFFTEKRDGGNREYEHTMADYRGAEFNGKSYMEIYDYSLKGEKEALDAFIWKGEFGITEEIPLEAYHKIEFAGE